MKASAAEIYRLRHSRLRPRAAQRTFGSANADIDRGREILEQYYGHLVELYGVSDNFNDFLKANGFKEGFIEGLGLGANAAGMTVSQTNDAMYKLARDGHGMVPKNKTNFTDYMINTATTISNWEALKYTTAETATNIATGVQSAGQTIVETAKAANETAQLSAKIIQYAPIIGILGIGYLMYISVRRA